MTSSLRRRPNFYAALRRDRDDVMMDVVLVASDGTTYKAHKKVIMKKWTNPGKLMPTRSSELPHLQTTVPSKLLDLILDYCYDVDIKIDRHNFTTIEQLLDCASALNLTRLIDKLMHAIVARMTPHNCLTVWKLCRQFHYAHSFKVHDFVLYHLVEHVNTSLSLLYDWYRLTAGEVAFLLGDARLNVRDEDDAWYLACTWMRANRIERAKYARRFALQLRFQTRIELLAFTSRESFGLLPKGIERSLQVRAAERRVPRDLILVVGGRRGLSQWGTVEFYDKRTREWKSTPQFLNISVVGHTMVSIGKDIYCIGDRPGKCIVSCAVPPADPNTIAIQWQLRAPMHSNRAFAASCVLNGKIYVFGGANLTDVLSSAECYDPAINQWKRLPNMQTSRGHAAAVALDGRIYVMGGCDDRQLLSSVEIFDEDAGTWTDATAMNTPRKGHSAVVWNGGILVAGGMCPIPVPELEGEEMATNSVEFFNPTRRNWTEMVAMDAIRFNFAMVVFDGEVLAIGGQEMMNMTSRVVERFDGTRWRIDSLLRNSRSQHQACVLHDWPCAEMLVEGVSMRRAASFSWDFIDDYGDEESESISAVNQPSPTKNDPTRTAKPTNNE